MRMLRERESVWKCVSVRECMHTCVCKGKYDGVRSRRRNSGLIMSLINVKEH